MPRLPILSREELSPEARVIYDRLAVSRGIVRGPSAMLMHHPALAERVGELIDQLRYRGVLSAADRELTILTAGREVESTYEWSAHEPLARQVGVSEAAIEALRQQCSTDGLASHEALIIDTVRSLYRQHRLSDELYARAEAALGRQALVELVALAGCYGMLGYILNGFAVELPQGEKPAFAR